MDKKIHILTILLLLIIPFPGWSGNESKNADSGNPVIPGYFADPTIKKFGDTFYIYATSDGEKLASGKPTVWISKDFVNWYNYILDIKVPEGLTNCWAPDVLKGADGNYYYYMGNCQFGCNIYGYTSESPMGPWKPINNGQPVIPVGTGKDNLPALDAQFLQDDDGSIYSYFGTWCTSFGGVGWAKINSHDFATIEKSSLIPINQVPNDFEANYPIKRNGKYLLMYSSGDCRLNTYAVHYAWADNPMGPFHYGQNNPILSSNSDGIVDSPGHHSILENKGDYYIIYHRHDNPHSSGGMFRQVCVDKLVFSNDTTIEKVIPTNQGIGFLAKNEVPFENLALGAKTKATSYYHLKAVPNHFNPKGIDFEYKPEFVTDDNNGTLWKAARAKLPQSIVIDLGKIVNIKRIVSQFEYATYFYQYKLEVSDDSIRWRLFADKTSNRRCGSPVIDDNNLDGRFIRLTITGTQKSGMYAAVWNIKVYNSQFDIPEFQNKEVNDETGVASSESKLVDLNPERSPIGEKIIDMENSGTLGGKFIAVGNPVIAEVEGIKAVKFDENSELRLSVKAPASLSWNSAYTASAWVYNPEIGEGECLMVWNSRENMLMGSYAALSYGKGSYGAVAHGDGYIDIPYNKLPVAGKWHTITISFDGMIENVYVDGKPDTQLPLSLFVESDTIRIGASGEPSENFSGYIARIQLFDKAFSADEVQKLMNSMKPVLNK
jgi:xylan 1,4-beta-xylosidase